MMINCCCVYLLIYNTAYNISEYPSVSQIDFVPTFSLLMGIPIPFGNLGGIIPELFFGMQRRHINTPTHNDWGFGVEFLEKYWRMNSAMKVNIFQIRRYLDTYLSLSALYTVQFKYVAKIALGTVGRKTLRVVPNAGEKRVSRLRSDQNPVALWDGGHVNTISSRWKNINGKSVIIVVIGCCSSSVCVVIVIVALWCLSRTITVDFQKVFSDIQ
jgi:hypothetical protein